MRSGTGFARDVYGVWMVLALLATGCAPESGYDDQGNPGTADDIGEGEFGDGCGTPDASAGINEFSYQVDDLTGCNDVQTFTFSFDTEWGGGPALYSEYALTSGRVELTVTDASGERVAETYQGEEHDYASVYPDGDDSPPQPGELTARLVFAGAMGAFTVRAYEDDHAD